ncbi:MULTISPECIES: hypothetical protein [Providencia]|uniref:Uncharacterized protein n=1 Tax=Providencia rettgeri TaxID=587 RepID=A0AAW6UR21_PRORE|nr:MULTISPECIES: hypothetical protein [Providencia]MDI9095073.1 hypothetical protein [Providencia rettgeri]
MKSISGLENGVFSSRLRPRLTGARSGRSIRLSLAPPFGFALERELPLLFDLCFGVALPWLLTSAMYSSSR